MTGRASAAGSRRLPAETADVIVVGAGPAGSSVALRLAQAGLDVLVLEKARFPREKVCGDGLTPRAVKALTGMGIPMVAADGWRRTKGVRMVAGRSRLEVSWPELSSYPGYGMVRGRMAFDETLAQHAQKAGADLREGMTVTGPLVDERTGRIVGVAARSADHDPGSGGGPAAARRFRARLVVAADGNSSRVSVSMGLRRREDRPLAVAVRTYYTSPRHADDYLEVWLDLRDGRRPLPGYGWIFPMGDGTSNVGVGLLNTSAGRRNIDTRALLRRWLAAMPTEFRLPEQSRTQPVRGAALPMGFNRTPPYTKGLLLTGDAAGLVNPFTGEGIAYALESGEIAAQVITQALARPHAAATENVLQTYPAALKDAYGGYYALGRAFLHLIGNSPALMPFAVRHGLKRRARMRFALKLLGNLTETRGGDAAHTRPHDRPAAHHPGDPCHAGPAAVAVAPYGAVPWVLNARAAGQVRLRRGRDRHDYTLRQLPAAQAGPILQRYLRIAPAVRPYFQAGKDSPVGDFIAEADCHPVFELIPIGEASAGDIVQESRP